MFNDNVFEIKNCAFKYEYINIFQGGFNSVIWTDTLQATLMLGSCLVVMIMGINKVGGISEVWEIGEKGKRVTLFK